VKQQTFDPRSSFKPRILVINSAQKWIGEAAYCLTLVQGLRSLGFFVILVCRKGNPLHQAALREQIPHYCLRMKGKFTGIDDLCDLLALYRIISRHHIDVIHCHRGKDHWLSACVRMLFPGKTRRIALVRTRHVTVPVKRHLFNRWLYKHATDAVTAVSKSAAASLKGLPMKRPIHLIYGSVDSERFSPMKRSVEILPQCGIPESEPAGPLVGLIARIQRIKGQVVFIQAAPRILEKQPHARFVISGTGAEERKDILRMRAKQLGIHGRFVMAGYREDIERLIASLDVGVVASLGSEGSSRIIMEYMASGVPVVATRVGGIPELLEQGDLGRLVDPGNPEQLADAIIETIVNQEETKKMKEKALLKARGFLNIKRFLEETLQVYCEVLSHNIR
jgi:glycosyltransferase involved in cell wall biosynthesis